MTTTRQVHLLDLAECRTLRQETIVAARAFLRLPARASPRTVMAAAERLARAARAIPPLARWMRA